MRRLEVKDRVAETGQMALYIDYRASSIGFGKNGLSLLATRGRSMSSHLPRGTRAALGLPRGRITDVSYFPRIHQVQLRIL